MSLPVRVLIVDDHPVLADAVRSLIEDHDDLEVVGMAADTAGAVEAAEAGRPDVVLMDFRLRGGDGPRAARAILERQPDVAVVFLSADSSDAARGAAAQAGAVEYLVKSTGMGDLVDAVRRAALSRFGGGAPAPVSG
jgi:DNA-binding NarL/FixJ family response regulator